LKEESLLGDVLRAFLSGIGCDDVLELGMIHRRWPQISGERLAGRSEPVALREGRLVVLTPAPVWASEVHLAAPSLIRRIREETGIEVVEIRVKTGAETQQA